MTREEAKELLPIIQAFAEGKTIQIRKYGEESYYDSTKSNLNFALDCYSYRVKPENKYRSFEDTDECWQEMLKHQPFGWVKEKAKSSYENLACISEGSKLPIGFAGYGSADMGIVVRPGFIFDTMFEHFTFADGAPFGVKEEA